MPLIVPEVKAKQGYVYNMVSNDCRPFLFDEVRFYKQRYSLFIVIKTTIKKWKSLSPKMKVVSLKSLSPISTIQYYILWLKSKCVWINSSFPYMKRLWIRMKCMWLCVDYQESNQINWQSLIINHLLQLGYRYYSIDKFSRIILLLIFKFVPSWHVVFQCQQ